MGKNQRKPARERQCYQQRETKSYSNMRTQGQDKSYSKKSLSVGILYRADGEESKASLAALRCPRSNLSVAIHVRATGWESHSPGNKWVFIEEKVQLNMRGMRKTKRPAWVEQRSIH